MNEYKEYVPSEELIRELETIITDLKNNAYCLDAKINKNYKWDTYKTHITLINYKLNFSIIPSTKPVIETNKCEWCGKSFKTRKINHNKDNYCSNDCYNQARTEAIMKTLKGHY